MTDKHAILGDELRAFKRALPGVVVFVAVLVLLRGFEGTADALKLQISTFAKSFLGGGEELVRVLLHTMPLAVAAAIVAFSISSRWLKFESPWSIVVLACSVMAGAVVGGYLRGLVPDLGGSDRHQPLLIAERPTGDSITPTQIDDAQKKTSLKVGAIQSSVRQSVVMDASDKWSVERPALQQLSEIDWFAEPNLKNAPPAKLAPLHLFPRLNGIAGVVSMAANQVLGYLVAYKPRLFLAAILAGSWIGWRWQRRLKTWRKRMTERVDDAFIVNEPRKAA